MFLSEIREIFISKWKNTIEYYQKNGFAKSLSYSLHHLGIFKKELIFFEMNIPDRTPCLDSDYSLELVRLGVREVQEMPVYNDGWFSREQALQRLADGHMLLSIKKDSKLIFFQWIEPEKGRILFFDIPFVLPDNLSVYKAFIYTPPEFRRQGVASRAKRLILKFLEDNGYRKAFLVIEPHNMPSIRANKKVGFREYQKVTYRKMIFFNYYFIRDFSTDRHKRVWTVANTGKEQRIWKTYSKIWNE